MRTRILTVAAGFLLIPTLGYATADHTPTPDRNATRTAPQITPENTPIEEDDPRWNCLTMGNRTCGPTWTMVTPELGDALSEGDDRTGYYPWETCRVNEGDTTYIVCPDGTVITS